MSVPRLLAAFAAAGTFVSASALPAQHTAHRTAPAGTPAKVAPTKSVRYKPTDTLPFDRAVIRGQLPNGLKYYIRRNAKPEHRAELRLVVHAGSLQEDDDQRGLAHMVEHMEFEGSPHFPNRSLVGYFESIGMTFGADLNAMTTFDYTMYQLRVPTTDAGQFGRAFDVLQDWAGAATFDSVALAAQRGIVLEEWRGRQGVGTRMQKKTFPVLFKGSRYAEREPIGDPEIIKSATREKLVRFYKDWYRPNLMAVVAVGDFDPKQVEAMIKSRFAGLKNPATPRPRAAYAIPDNIPPLVAVVQDTEATGVGASITYKIPRLAEGTIASARESIVRNVFQSAIGQRYHALTQSSRAPFLGAGAGFGNLTEKQDAFSISVGTRNDGLIGGLNATLAEIERIAQFGITEAELGRFRTTMLASLDNSLASRADATSDGFAAAYVSAFIGGVASPDMETYANMVRQLLPTITSDDVKRVAAVWRTPENRVVIAQLPKSLDIMVPDSGSLLASFRYPLRNPLTPYVETVRNEPLLPEEPTPGRIVKRESLTNGITEWTLSNGIRVLLRPSTNSTDRMAIIGTSPGGYNLELDKGRMPAQTAAGVVEISGLGNFSLIELQKRLTGRSVQLGVGVDAMSETLSAAMYSNEMETAFQLLYLAATHPRVDPDAFESMQRRARISIENRNVSPEQQFQDTVTLTMAQYNPLVQLPTVAMIDSMDAAKSLEAFKSRFKDMSDFRFIIVGRFSLDSISPLVERYLASLPGGGRVETPKDMGIRPPTGMVHKVVAAGTEPKATTVMSFYGKVEMTPENEWNLYALTEIIRMRLLERLRQEMGGTYTPSVQISMSDLPYPSYAINISFITSPERDEELAKATIAVLDSLRRAPALESDVEKVRAAQMQGSEEALKEDGYWLAKISRFDQLHRPFALIGNQDIPRAWTAADVQRTAQKYLTLDSYARFDLVPAPGAGSGTH